MLQAQQEAANLGHAYLGTEHFLLGLLQSEKNPSASLAQLVGVDYARTRTAILALLGEGNGPLALTPRAKRVLQRARQIAVEYGQEAIQPDHLLLSLLLDKDNLGAGVLFQLGVEIQPLVRRLQERAAQMTDQSA
jgi:ATP-dependent Clp protease ATP-binding subunit ClpC